MAPFADAVGFVNGDSREFALGVAQGEFLAEIVVGAGLGRDVEEANEWVSGAEIIEDVCFFRWRGRAVDGSGFDAEGAEGVDLVFLVVLVGFQVGNARHFP